eukprot:5398337-Lingulodinium_polyedra.AAC.1
MAAGEPCQWRLDRGCGSVGPADLYCVGGMPARGKARWSHILGMATDFLPLDTSRRAGIVAVRWCRPSRCLDSQPWHVVHGRGTRCPTSAVPQEVLAHCHQQ